MKWTLDTWEMLRVRERDGDIDEGVFLSMMSRTIFLLNNNCQPTQYNGSFIIP